MALKSVEFKRFEASSTQPKVIVKDSIEDVSVNGHTISFSFKRKACFEPDAFFSIVVEFIYIADIEDESMKTIEEEGKTLNVEYVASIAKKIVNNTTIPTHASLVISNNTSINGAAPLITQPSFID